MHTLQGAAPAGADLTAGSNATATATTATLTPLEQLFRKHMQRTLGSFKQHTDTLQATLNARVKAIEVWIATATRPTLRVVSPYMYPVFVVAPARVCAQH